MNRLLIPAAALLWGLQASFLLPALGLLLVALYGASPAEVGWVLAVYNASGFAAALLLPAYADRKRDYLRPMLACSVLTVALTGVLAATSQLSIATLGLVLLGGPANVGNTLMFAHLRHSGAQPPDVVRTRALISIAWVGGPPLASLIIGTLGNRAILIAIAVIAVAVITTTGLMLARRAATADDSEAAPKPVDDQLDLPRTRIAVIVVAFVLLHAANVTTVVIMNLYVTTSLGLPVFWAGVTLGVAAALEIPALLLIGRLSKRFSALPLVSSGALAGIGFCALLVAAQGPVVLLAAQLLSAWYVAAVAGIGITLFQQIIPRPGLASGMYANSRRIGAVVSGGVIALGAGTTLGYRGIFLASAVLITLALLAISYVARPPRPA